MGIVFIIIGLLLVWPVMKLVRLFVVAPTMKKFDETYNRLEKEYLVNKVINLKKELKQLKGDTL